MTSSDILVDLPEPRPQFEIISNWRKDSNKPLVSICCIAYNQERYIENTLKGFLSQVTDFPFEILIHDDASTDRTSDIIRKYHQNYPNIIKPLIQKENQYSKGLKINPTYNFPRAQGKYIAMCEGDDYWLVSDKLQKQYEVSERFGCAVVFHSAIELELPEERQKVICKYRNSDGFVPLVDAVKGRGGFMPTASLFFRSDLVRDCEDWFTPAMPLGDYFLQLILSYNGLIYYINEEMCVYRRNSIGSWTANQKKPGESKKYAKKMVKALENFYVKLGSTPKKYYLAYPYFFYVRKSYFNPHAPFVSVSNILKDFPRNKFSLKFKFLFFLELIKLPGVSIVKLLRTKGRKNEL